MFSGNLEEVVSDDFHFALGVDVEAPRAGERAALLLAELAKFLGKNMCLEK